MRGGVSLMRGDDVSGHACVACDMGGNVHARIVLSREHAELHAIRSSLYGTTSSPSAEKTLSPCAQSQGPPPLRRCPGRPACRAAVAARVGPATARRVTAVLHRLTAVLARVDSASSGCTRLVRSPMKKARREQVATGFASSDRDDHFFAGMSFVNASSSSVSRAMRATSARYGAGEAMSSPAFFTTRYGSSDPPALSMSK